MKHNDKKPAGSTLTTTEAAAMLNVHTNTIAKLIESGELPAAKIGRSYVMLYKDVMQYIENMIVRQTAERMGGQPIKRKRSPHFAGQV